MPSTPSTPGTPSIPSIPSTIRRYSVGRRTTVEVSDAGNEQLDSDTMTEKTDEAKGIMEMET